MDILKSYVPILTVTATEIVLNITSGLFIITTGQRESWATVVTPLATLSLLGAATAVATNPLLMTMAGLSNRRRRRDARPMHQIQVLEKYLSKVAIFKRDELGSIVTISYLEHAGWRSRDSATEADGHLFVLFGVYFVE